MNELQVQDFHGKKVIDSREVAVMVEKQHKNLLADIRSYIAAMGKSNELKIQPVDFFIPSTYQDGKGETRPCYLLTKKGCDMVANKTTGEKGVLFSAAYVSAFEEMREALAPLIRPSVRTGAPSPLEGGRLWAYAKLLCRRKEWLSSCHENVAAAFITGMWVRHRRFPEEEALPPDTFLWRTFQHRIFCWILPAQIQDF